MFEVSFKRPDLQINNYKRRVIDGKGFKHVRKDLQKDLIKLNKSQKRIGPDKGGHWKVIK